MSDLGLGLGEQGIQQGPPGLTAGPEVREGGS